MKGISHEAPRPRSDPPPPIEKIHHDVVRPVVPQGGPYGAPLLAARGDVHDDARRLVRRSEHPGLQRRVAKHPPEVIGFLSTFRREQRA